MTRTDRSPWLPVLASIGSYVVAALLAMRDHDSAATIAMNITFVLAVAAAAPAWLITRRPAVALASLGSKVGAALLAMSACRWAWRYEAMDIYYPGTLELFWGLGPALIAIAVFEVALARRM